MASLSALWLALYWLFRQSRAILVADILFGIAMFLGLLLVVYWMTGKYSVY